LKKNLPEALFDVAHEVIHCLGPVQTATVLEEGLALHFSLYHAHPEAGLPADYAEALRLYKAFVSAGGDIRPLREVEPYVLRADPGLIKRLAPKLTDDDMNRLRLTLDQL